MKRHDFSPEPKLSTFMIDYPYDGGTATLYLEAYSIEDAERRLEALSGYGELIGELIESGEVASMAVN